MDDRRFGSALRRAVLSARTPRHSRDARGVWDRPAVLDLVSDLLMLMAGMALIYATVIWFLARPFFPLREIVVLTPPGKVDSAQIEFAARSGIAGNFFTVELDETREVFEQLPWVRRAEVRRRWPDALELRIEEHQPVARWENNETDAVRLINRQGELFAAESARSLPELKGPQGSARYLLSKYRDYSEALEPLGYGLNGLWLSARESWELELDNGMVVVLGRERERAPVGERLARFVRAWPEVEQRLGIEVAVADMRYPRGFAVTPANSPNETEGTE